MTVVGERAGPTGVRERSLGPDLARGFMLLFIALANSHYFLRAPEHLGGFPAGGPDLDRAVAWAISTFVDGRAFPFFGVLFGYGVARIAARQAARGPRGVRRLLWRRAAVLVAVGFLHGLLLYAGDILAAYGVLLLVGAWTVRWRDGWLLGVAAFFFVLTSLPGEDSSSIATTGPERVELPPDLLTQVTERPLLSLFIAALGPVGFACPFLLGLWAGRRRLLERPERHRRLLGLVAAGGIGAAVLGAQPAALMLLDGERSGPLNLIGPLHDATGVLGGLGLAAAFALLAARIGDRRGPVVSAIAAVGQRSMTCYLAQSLVWAAVFVPYLLDLSGTLSIAATALLATGTWLATVALAAWMSRAGRRGPFEALIRRVTYGARPA